MHTLHRTLHLQHRRHTGKLLHHRHTSYRGLAVVLGLAAVTMAGLNLLGRVTADSFVVSARISAQIPATSATITSPVDGSSSTVQTIQVSGTCPVLNPKAIVTIEDNAQLVGSVACDTNSDFSVPINLFVGLNQLVAHVYNVTGDAGPDSSLVRVTFTPLIPPAPVTSPSSGGSGSPGNGHSSVPTATTQSLPPITISADQLFVVYGPGSDAVWSGTFSGGLPPYHVRIAWGDGSVTNYTAGTDQQWFNHQYRVMRSYDAVLQVTDVNGTSATLHFAAVTPYVSHLFGTGTGNSGIGSDFWQRLFGRNPIVGIYGAYLLLLALFGLIWLYRHPFAYARVEARGHVIVGAKRRKSDHRGHR